MLKCILRIGKKLKSWHHPSESELGTHADQILGLDFIYQELSWSENKLSIYKLDAVSAIQMREFMVQAHAEHKASNIDPHGAARDIDLSQFIDAVGWELEEVEGNTEFQFTRAAHRNLVAPTSEARRELLEWIAKNAGDPSIVYKFEGNEVLDYIIQRESDPEWASVLLRKPNWARAVEKRKRTVQ